mmetsp:Transcript_20604/g.57310  ORF Transcript_20604/g.57310 Transcript_20604/m.57310 type:complete len:201 (-) Transcript_20604:450-1052(-)
MAAPPTLPAVAVGLLSAVGRRLLLTLFPVIGRFRLRPLRWDFVRVHEVWRQRLVEQLVRSLHGLRQFRIEPRLLQLNGLKVVRVEDWRLEVDAPLGELRGVDKRSGLGESHDPAVHEELVPHLADVGGLLLLELHQGKSLALAVFVHASGLDLAEVAAQEPDLLLRDALLYAGDVHRAEALVLNGQPVLLHVLRLHALGL